MNVSGHYCAYLIRTIDLFAQNIMQECLEEGKSWHYGVICSVCPTCPEHGLSSHWVNLQNPAAF